MAEFAECTNPRAYRWTATGQVFMQLKRINVFRVIISLVRHDANIKVLRVNAQNGRGFRSEEVDVSAIGQLLNDCDNIVVRTLRANKNERPFRMLLAQA